MADRTAEPGEVLPMEAWPGVPGQLSGFTGVGRLEQANRAPHHRLPLPPNFWLTCQR